MILLKGITKRYGALTVYENFDFSIEDGTVTCILGESGSGKTTLLNILAGLTPFEGSVSPQSRCSYVFQQPRLVPSLTVAGNLRLVCKDAGRVSRMLEEVGLEDRAGEYPCNLSGGQAQRVSLARAFLHPAGLILLDEPFSSLDLATKLKVADLFLRLREREGRTAVFVTHDVDEALMLSHRIVVLKGGKAVAELRPQGEPCADLFACRAPREELLRLLM